MSTDTDIAEHITIGIYSKTGRANSPINQNPDFQAGFSHGSQIPGDTTLDAIWAEWKRRGSPFPLPIEFQEWKRGLWAAVMQKQVANNLETAKRMFSP